MRHFYVSLVLSIVWVAAAIVSGVTANVPFAALGVVFTNDKTDRSSPTAGGERTARIQWRRRSYDSMVFSDEAF